MPDVNRQRAVFRSIRKAFRGDDEEKKMPEKKEEPKDQSITAKIRRGLNLDDDAVRRRLSGRSKK